MVVDKNYGRMCAVLAATPKRALVALAQRTKSRRSGKTVYQLRWRPLIDLDTAALQSTSEALRLVTAAIRALHGDLQSRAPRAGGSIAEKVARFKGVRMDADDATVKFWVTKTYGEAF